MFRHPQPKRLGEELSVKLHQLRVFRKILQKPSHLIDGRTVQRLHPGQSLAHLIDIAQRQRNSGVIHPRCAKRLFRNLVGQHGIEGIVQEPAEVFVVFVLPQDFLLFDGAGFMLEPKKLFDCCFHPITPARAHRTQASGAACEGCAGASSRWRGRWAESRRFR